MKKLLLSLAAGLLAFPVFAQEENTNEPIFYGEPSNMVLTIQAMDSATEIGEEPAEVNYFLQPIGDSNKYSTNGFDITLKGYTDPSRGDKPAKYIYSIKYYKYGYGNEAPEGENNNPIGNADNSYTVFISENDADISLAVCAVWPDGKNYVEWIHNFSNIVATDANVYAYLFISGNDLPKTYTYVNKFAAQTGTLDGTSLTKFYTKSDTNATNISTSFMKGNSQSGLVYLSDNTFNNDKEDGVYKATLDYGTGELTLTPVADEFEIFIDGFTTVVTPFDFELTDGVNAYILSYNSEGQHLDAEPIEGSSVKAYTPVVLASSEIGDYKFRIVSEGVTFEPTLVEGQAKKGTLADSRMDGNVLVGVNHPHWIDTYAGKAEDAINNRYTLSGHQFIINKALSTKKNYDNPITPQYTCYVELPSDLETVPQTLDVVFPTEEEEEETYAEYYLANNMTENYGGNFTINPSYKFQKTEDEEDAVIYTLTVGNVPSSAEFYIIQKIDDEEIAFSASGFTGDTAMAPTNGTQTAGGSEVTLEEETGEDIDKLQLNGNYINVTFTLYINGKGNPQTLTFAGTVNDDVWTVSPGNDQTMQSGTVTDGSDGITAKINITTVSSGALAYIFVPSTYKEDVWYTVTANPETETAAVDEDEPTAKKATITDGQFTVPLKVNTSGLITIYGSDDTSTEPLATFSYIVSGGTPTAVEAVEAASEDGPIYNVFGQRVDENYKGIVIRNGKKFLQR